MQSEFLYFQRKRALYVSFGNRQCRLNSEHAGNPGFGQLVNRIETATWFLGCRRAVSLMFTLRIPADVWDSIKIKPASTEVEAGSII